MRKLSYYIGFVWNLIFGRERYALISASDHFSKAHFPNEAKQILKM